MPSVTWKGILLTLLVIAATVIPVAAEEKFDLTGGGGHVIRAKVITVHVWADARWRPYVREGYQALERALPGRGPRITIVEHPYKSCTEVKDIPIGRAAIAICSGPISGYEGSTRATQDHHAIDGRTVFVAYDDGELRDPHLARNLVCHEGMHSLSWVNDNYTYGHDSCIQGDLDYPGPWDRAFLRRAYRIHDDKKDGR